MCLTGARLQVRVPSVETKPMRKVALTQNWDLIQLEDGDGVFALLFNLETNETIEVATREDLFTALGRIL